MIDCVEFFENVEYHFQKGDFVWGASHRLLMCEVSCTDCLLKDIAEGNLSCLQVRDDFIESCHPELLL